MTNIKDFLDHGPLDHGPLGANSEYPEQYEPGVLHAIPRTIGRGEIGITSAELPFYGIDIWNAYELSWLNPRGKPQVALMELRVPAQSPCIVESKSLKLYLGSFNQWRVESQSQLAEIIANDIGHTVGMSVTVKLYPSDAALEPEFIPQTLPGRCIDDVDIEPIDYTVNPSLLACENNDVQEVLHSHLLRSCCPVTGQPDWASVMIEYEGKKIRDESLLAYLISFRNNQEFHEQCVERIFMDIRSHCSPTSLRVYARYTRRGGIDINPMRCSQENWQQDNLRLLRQ